MRFVEMIQVQRKATENHIRKLEADHHAGKRYTLMMKDSQLFFSSLICDLGCIIMLIGGIIHLSEGGNLLKSDLFFMLLGICMTVYLDQIHEEFICLKAQRDASFGLILLSGMIGVFLSLMLKSQLFLFGSILNVVGCLPIYVSFKAGIFYSE